VFREFRIPSGLTINTIPPIIDFGNGLSTANSKNAAIIKEITAPIM
jgi:hypothetical protein